MSTAIAERPAEKTLTIRDRLKSPAMIAELGKAMPAHCKPDRMARIALTALTKTPKLADCTQASFFECLLSLSQWGLEPDGRRAHLIPYGTTCTLIIDYKGLVELAYRSGVVRNIHADVVRDGDLFEFDRGQVTKHTPWFLRRDEGKPDQSGEVFAVYCLVELIGGAAKCEVLSKLDVEKIRSRSKAGKNGPWVTDWEEMAKKTAFRRVSKWLPLSAEIHDAFEKDADRLDPATLPEPRKPATLDSMSELINGSVDASSEQPEASDDLPDSSFTPPDELPLDDWAQFQASMNAAKTIADHTHASDYWLKKDFGPERNTEAIEISNKALARIRSAKGKQGELLKG